MTRDEKIAALIAAELSGRSSPEDHPDMLLIGRYELGDLMRLAFEEASKPASALDDLDSLRQLIATYSANLRKAVLGLETVRQALVMALPIKEQDLTCLIECHSSLREIGGGETEVVPGTLDEDVADEVAHRQDAVAAIKRALEQGGDNE